MKSKPRQTTNTRLWKWTLTSASLLGALSFSIAQDNDSDGDVFELSPFVVDSSADSGYVASHTLAGGRIATQIRDIGTSVEVVTKDFLEDIGADNVEEFLQYTTGGEVGGSQGNIVGYSESQFGGADSTAARRNPSQTTRIRGIGQPDNVRNYYKTTIPMDSYNTDRIDINRGANSMLFGLGSPAGLINSNYQRATMSDTSKVDFNIDSEGSYRAAVNFNRELIEDTLAVRLAGLYDQKKYNQNPSYRDDERVYGAITYKPFKNTTIRGHFEVGDIFGNAPDTLLPAQALDSFIMYRTPVDVFYNIQHFGDSEGPNAAQYAALSPAEQAMFVAPGTDARASIGGARMFGYALVYDGQNGGDPSFAYQPYIRGGAIEAGNPFWEPDFLADGTPNPGLANGNDTQMMFYDNLREVIDPVGPAQGFTNLDTFDFTKQNFGGDTDYFLHDFETYNLALEQLFFNGQAGIEIGFDYEEKENDAVTNFNGWKGQMQIDINKTLNLPAVNADGTPKTDSQGNVVSQAQPNPNFGRPFYLTEPNRSTSYEERETVRATAFVKYNFAEKHEGNWLLKWLGNHTITGLLDKNTERYRTANASHNTFSDDFNMPWHMGWVGTEQPGSGFRRTSKMVYMGPPIQSYINDPFNPNTPISMSDIIIESSTANLLDPNPSASINFWNLGPDAEGSNWTHVYWTEAQRQADPSTNFFGTGVNNFGDEPNWYTGDRSEYWDRGTIESRWVPGGNNSTRKTVVESFAINMQSKFFNDHLVANLGYREDVVDNYLNSRVISNHLLSQQGYDAALSGEQAIVPADLIGSLPDSFAGDWTYNVSPEFFRPQDGQYSHFDKGPEGEGSFGYGGVLHVPNNLRLFKLPHRLDLSLHYNYSKNFVPDASRNTFKIGQNGEGYSFEPLASPIGESEDIGFTVGWDNKFSVRVNWFETSIKNNTTWRMGNTLNQLVDFATRAYIWADYDIGNLDPDGNGVIDVGIDGSDHPWKDNPRYDVSRTYQMRDAMQWVVDDGWMASRLEQGLLVLRPNGSGWLVNQSFPGLTDTEDRVSDGIEINLTYNPTPNWRIALNATKLESVSSNVGPLASNVMDRFFAVYEEVKDFVYWEASDANFNKNNRAGRWLDPRVETYFQDKLQEGKATNETREWYVNLVTNYNFREGRLKGWYVGGAIRWQSEGVVGYPRMPYEVTDGVILQVPNVDQPWKGSDALFVDVNVGYSTMIMNGKVRYNGRLHLKNINNIGSDNLTTVRARFDGTPTTVRWDPPLVISFTNSFTW
ncbi:MAG: TonB-dependent receptor plug domain-containing protein [Puniceicoccaceae bacterium]